MNTFLVNLKPRQVVKALHGDWRLLSSIVFALMFLVGAPDFINNVHAAPNDPMVRGAVEQGKAEAASLLEQGKAKEAYELYSSLLREEPEDDAINIGLARAAQAANRPNQAIMAYLRLLEKYPNEAMLHREIAQAYLAAGDKLSAAKHLSADPSLNSADQEALIGSNRYDQLQINGSVRAGVLYDSNANQGASSTEMNLGPWRVNVANAKAKETGAAFLSGQIDLGYRLDRASPWWIVGDVQTYLRGNANDDLSQNGSRHLEWGRTAAGVRFLDNRDMFDLRVKAEVFDYEFHQNVQAVGPEFLWVHAATPSVQFISRGGIDTRYYSSDKTRNGNYWTLGQYARVFVGSDKHEIMIGGRYLDGNPDKQAYAYDGWEGSAKISFRLPHGMFLSPHVSYTEERYDGPATVLEIKNRKDERLRTGVSLTYPINKTSSLEASYQYTENTSSSDFYNYRQNVVTVGGVWNF